MMMQTLTQLPIDLITDILSRLPAKTLCCLKIVCKSWYNLISDKYFVNYHIERSLVTKTNLQYIVTPPMRIMQGHHDEPNYPIFYSADFDSLDNPALLRHPLKDFKTPMWVIASCRGLILLSVDDSRLLLYNPTTQTFNVLPHVPLSIPVPDYTRYVSGFGSDSVSMDWNTRYVFGFGYDSVSMDWKCVRIMMFLNKETGFSHCEVMVYSLNANCWKSVLDIPCYFNPCGSGTCNGALVHDMFHWVGTNIDDVFEVIVFFSFRDETFSCLPLPGFQFQPKDKLFVGMLDGCLCLLANRGLRCDIWFMKEHGVAESWTRMFSIEKREWERFRRPISFSMEKKKLLVFKSSEQLAYIDLETMKHTNVVFAGWNIVVDAHVSVENLLMLGCSKFADYIHIRKKQHEKRKNKKRRRSSN